MSVAHKYLPHYTYDDYVLWEGHWEIIDGIPYAMSPSPLPQHQWIASVLSAEFIDALRKNNCNCKVYQPIDYRLSDDTVFNPDLSIVCQPITKKFLDFPPDVVVEILSEATRMKDRNVKYPKYEQAGVRYYIMIEPEAKTIELYQLTNGLYQRQPVDLKQPYAIVLNDCRFEITFDHIWQ